MQMSNQVKVYKTSPASIVIKAFKLFMDTFFIWLFFIKKPLLIVVFGLLLIIWFIVDRHFEVLELTDEELIYKSGIVSKKVLRINRERIKAIDVSKNILGKIFSFGLVNIETAVMGAATGSTSIKIFLKDNSVSEVKEYIIGSKKSEYTDELITEDLNISSEETDNVIYSNTPTNKELFWCGVTSGGIFFGIFLLYQGLFWFIEIGLKNVLDGMVEVVLATMYDISVLEILLLSVLSFVILMSGIGVFWILKFYGFKLCVTDEKINIKYGFFNTKEYDFYRKNIKAVIINSNPVRQIFSYSEIKLEVKGYSGMGTGSIILIPFIKNSDIDYILNKFLGDFVIDGKVETVKKGKRQYILRPVIYNILISIGLFIIFKSYKVFWWNIISIFSIIARVLVVKNTSLAYNNTIISGSSGGFYKQNKRFRAKDIQSINIKQRPYQKLLNIGDIMILYYSEVGAKVDLISLSKTNLENLARVARGLGVETDEDKRQDKCYENIR